MPSLTLYYKPMCPYCQKVLNFMNQNKISLPLKNTENENLRGELIKLGGKPQVPCLSIDGKALYESDDIVEWLNKNRVRSKKKNKFKNPVHDN